MITCVLRQTQIKTPRWLLVCPIICFWYHSSASPGRGDPRPPRYRFPRLALLQVGAHQRHQTGGPRDGGALHCVGDGPSHRCGEASICFAAARLHGFASLRFCWCKSGLGGGGVLPSPSLLSDPRMASTTPPPPPPPRNEWDIQILYIAIIQRPYYISRWPLPSVPRTRHLGAQDVTHTCCKMRNQSAVRRIWRLEVVLCTSMFTLPMLQTIHHNNAHQRYRCCFNIVTSVPVSIGGFTLPPTSTAPDKRSGKGKLFFQVQRPPTNAVSGRKSS